ncbi:MAG TPA: hypothetical protein VKG64_11540 [Methylomirabilota bacterium]|nr:hypothetical protein [Methylomirabilota bacterium]
MVLTALAVALGAYHGLVGLLGLILVRTGPEPWDVLIMSVALASTPAALTLAAWGARRLAAAWLALAALAWAVFGYRGVWPEWAYAALYYAPQLVAALVLSRRRPGAASALAATPATPHVSSPTPARLVGWGLALALGVGHATLGLWLVVRVAGEGRWAPWWWMGGVASLLSTLPAVVSARRRPTFGGRWLVGAAYLGVLAAGRALYLEDARWAFGFLVWWLPQCLLGVLFLRRRPAGS